MIELKKTILAAMLFALAGSTNAQDGSVSINYLSKYLPSGFTSLDKGAVSLAINNSSKHFDYGLVSTFDMNNKNSKEIDISVSKSISVGGQVDIKPVAWYIAFPNTSTKDVVELGVNISSGKIPLSVYVANLMTKGSKAGQIIKIKQDV